MSSPKGPSVLVVNEPYVKDFCRTQRWAARSRGRVLRAPDWLAYATAVLEQQGCGVRLLDMVAAQQTKEDLRAIARRAQPDFVVLDATTPSIYSDIECARIIKEVSRAKVIMVGPHVSALAEETLQTAQGAVDAVCIGEYDYTVRDCVMCGNDLSRVPGIAFWHNGKAVRTAPRPLIEDLDALPFPAWHQLDPMKYFDGGKLYPYIDIISGRGCPNQCVFCLWPQVVHGTRYRLRSARNVVDEIEHDIRLCPRVLRGGEFFFEDDTFTVDPRRAIAVCEEIMRRNLRITFSVNARADSADAAMFARMKQAGCRELLVGFESGDQQILDAARKRITVAQSRHFVQAAKAAGLTVHGCFVIGLPGETEETAARTVQFALTLGCDTLQFSGAVPFPGTAFFRMAEEKGWLTTRQWDRWLGEGEQTGVVKYPGLSQERIDYFVNLGLKKFYFRPQFMVKFVLSNRDFTDLYRKLRGAMNFVRYLCARAR
jgi:radical SAM superfamily enzyme YgiQ (UPF0313 family)